VVFTVGDTTILLPVNAPGFHVYVVAPLAVSVALLPIQMLGEVAEAVTVGFGVTLRLTVLVVGQPKPLIPVTE
jgi:hypothetical protein